MIKKLLFFTSCFALSYFLIPTGISLTFAQNVTPQDLFYNFKYTDQAHQGNESKIQYVSKLPQGGWEQILASVIKLILAITGTLALISFTVSGIMMVTARGEEDALTKAKHMLLWSILALAVIAVSYALVLGISQLNFFGGSAAVPNSSINTPADINSDSSP